MNILWLFGSIWFLLLVNVAIAGCFVTLRVYVIKARYVILIYTLLILACFLYYYYLVGGRLDYPDSAIDRNRVYQLLFTILPLIISAGLWHITNRILPPSMRKRSTQIFIISWIISPIILLTILKMSSDPEAMMGIIGIFVFASVFSFFASILSMIWFILVTFFKLNIPR